MDSEDKFAIAMMAIGCATLLGLTGLLVPYGDEINAAIDASKKASQDVSPAIEHANECPLDAVAYDAPAFTNRVSPAYKVTDRFSGQTWWVVDMGSQWVVLPITNAEVANVG